MWICKQLTEEDQFRWVGVGEGVAKTNDGPHGEAASRAGMEKKSPQR